VLVCAVSGCQRRWVEETDSAGLRVLHTERRSGGDGTARVVLKVEEGETALLATASVPRPLLVHVRSVIDPDGTEVFASEEWNLNPLSKTNAGFIASTSSLNWPINLDDLPLRPGRWTLELGVLDAEIEPASAVVQVDALLKSDPDLSAGRVSVAVVYTGSLGDDPALTGAIEQAQEAWTEMLAPLSLAVSFEGFDFEGTGLRSPVFGEEDAYIDIASSTGLRQVNVVLSDTITDFADAYGLAGDIPGPLVPTPRSGVQISTLLAAGPDGEFSDGEIRLLAETMAHEVGHFLGLFHPVEADWSAWDVLSDTKHCNNERGCVETLGDNLMFPFPLCAGSGASVQCLTQDVITDEQAAVLHRYTGTE